MKLLNAHYNSSKDELLKISSTINNKLVMLKADLSSEDDISELLVTIEKDYGIPNKIVHLAASKFKNIRFKDICWNDFQHDLDISLKSIMIILNRFLPKLAKEKRGKVVFMLSSVTFNIPPKALTQYNSEICNVGTG